MAEATTNLVYDRESPAAIIAGNLAIVRSQIAEALVRSGRDADNPRLVAVTKRCPFEWTRALFDLGQRDFGENYPQELWRKVDQFPLVEGVRWHLIGHLQSNKLKRTWPRVEMVHGVDSMKLLEQIDRLAADDPPGPSVCLQLNLSGESTKHGWDERSFWGDLDSIAAFGHARIVGLMTMAGYDTTSETARPTFARLREIRDEAESRVGRRFPELSMGMSGDYVAAVEEGATLVRVGSALFQGLDEAGT